MLMQDAVAAGRVLSIEEGAKLGGACDDEDVVSIRGWLLRFLSDAEQCALGRLWLFKGGFGLGAASAMLGTETPTPVPRLLRDLEDASCLQAALSPAEAGGGVRYSVHALVGEIFQGQFSRLSGLAQEAILHSFGDVMIRHADQLTTMLEKEQWSNATALLTDEAVNFQQLCSLLHGPVLATWASSKDRLCSLNNLGCLRGASLGTQLLLYSCFAQC